MTTEQLTKLLEQLISLPNETEWVEFKENNYKPQEIGEYISALSNSACLHNKKFGYLVFGIEDEAHTIKGTSFKPKNCKIGAEEFENWIATQLEPRVDFTIFEFEYNDKPIVIFRVDSTLNSPVRFKGVEYIRVGSYKKKLSEFPEKERKIWSMNKNLMFESEIALNDISRTKILDLLNCEKYFELMGVKIPDNDLAVLNKFEEENLIRYSEKGYDITNLGAILFAKNLDNFDKLFRKAVRVIIYEGRDRLKTKKEQQGKFGYAIGFEGLVKYINSVLPSNEVLGQAFRKEVKMYPEVAIRELVANALIHQDFSITGTGPMVEIFNDRIEISNPGKPLIDTLRFIDHKPISRNEKLASFMRRINICEERGSGIDKVINYIEAFQLPAPKFFASDNYFEVTIFSFKSLRQMDKSDKIRACYQHCCLKYIKREFMTNQSLRERFKIEDKNYPIVSKIISDTIQEKLVKDYDPDNKSKKYSKYVPYWA